MKRVQTSLFGVVEVADQSGWLGAFAGSGATTTIDVDDSALDLIAEELELDAEGLAADAERYVQGLYRAKARGMGGSRLGDFGEVIAFLLNRGIGNEIVRVVSYRRGQGQANMGSRFPLPDFLVGQAGSTRALEVKSTEAFDFVRLRDTPKRWTWLQPCGAVAGCRSQALRQLGFVNGAFTPQQHSLLVRGGNVVPFPVGNGEAVAVLAVDGRVAGLRSEPKYKTPKRCRQAGRSCWACVDEECDVVVVTMPNAPGRLSLAGGSERQSKTWFDAYRRWGQALAARDLAAAASTVHELSESTQAWSRELDDAEAAKVLRGFWGSYLRDAMRTRGIAVDVPDGFGLLSDPGLGFDWRPAALAEPTVRETTFGGLAQALSGATDGLEPRLLSARQEGDEAGRGSIGLAISPQVIEVTLTSRHWWERRAVETDVAAAEVAKQILDLAIRMSGSQPTPLPTDWAVPLRGVDARVGDARFRLGWVSKGVTPGSSAWRRMPHRWWPWFEPELWPSWPLLLLLGDPRVRLHVLQDGRARLRIARSAWFRA
ncbi:MAG: hypothetical protein R3B13_38880 [Polyangiaceae bacterium]